MELISLVEYAKMHGKHRSRALRFAHEGRLKTARKIGRNWIIESDEPWPAGNYMEKDMKSKGEREEDNADN